MHPGANNFGRTLGKDAGHLGEGMAPASRNPSLSAPPWRTLFLLSFIALPFVIAGCTPSSPRFTSGRSGVPASDSAAQNNPAIDRHKVLSDIMRMMGAPYSEGGSDTGGIDCSGFTSRVYRDAAGKAIPRSCREQYEAGEPVDPAKLRFGDLVFFNIDGHPLSHVGIYVGDGLFAHASVSLGITVSLLDSAYYKRSYAGARRIVR